MTVLNVTGLKEEAVVQPGEDGTYAESRGGTEMMMEGLKARLDSELLEKFNIICSRVRKIDLNKPNILWLHDTWDDPESQHLKEEENLKKFMKLVFVSNYQQQTFNMGLGVPYSAGIVLQNAIEPIEVHEKPDPSCTSMYIPRSKFMVGNKGISSMPKPLINVKNTLISHIMVIRRTL